MVRRALISVHDKTGVVEFARALHEEFHVELISTGGTAAVLRAAGLPVTLVEELTGFPELLGGRVKTLHPAIHAAILADRDNPEHMRQLEAAGIKPIDLVVVNLYPFEKTVADPNCTFEQAIEMIDIGGVALLRAAAKNAKWVRICCVPDFYPVHLALLRESAAVRSDEQTADTAAAAFWITSIYDAAIMMYLSGRATPGGAALKALHCWNWGPVRYGENAGQSAELWASPKPSGALDLTNSDVVTGESQQSQISYNNYLDAHAALQLCSELSRALQRGSAKLCFAPGTAKLRFAVDIEGPSDACEREEPRSTPPKGGAPHAPHAAPPPPTPVHRGSPARTSAQKRAERLAPVRGDAAHRRNLPHWQVPGATYWITYGSRIGQLTPAERDAAFEALRFWDGKRVDVHAAVVMPDHIHALLTPRELAQAPGTYENLFKLLQSIKSFSGREISRLRGHAGQAWVHESFDHWIRSPQEFRDKWNYLATNIVKEQLAARPEDYRWWYAVDLFDQGIGTPRTASTPIPPVLGGSPPPSARRAGDTGATAGEPPGPGPSVADGKAELCSPRGKAELCSPGGKAELCSPGGKAELCSPRGKAELCTPRPSACVFIKHTNACGAAVHVDAEEAYRKAYLADPNAAMGGVLAVDCAVDAGFAACVMETYERFGKPLKEAGARHAPGGFFVEVWIAPRFTDDAVAIIRGTYDPADAKPEAGEPRIDAPPKKPWGERVRLLAVGDMTAAPDPDEFEYRSIAGGMLVQTPDLIGLNEEQWKVVTKRAPTDAEWADLRLAWLIAKHTKSNAISIVKDGMLIGNGAGQMSRVMSCRIAVWLAQENGHARSLPGSAAASDAFFPFADGPNLLLDAGVTALIQPGGSKRDQETIDACDARGAAMVFTGTRHFRH